MEKETYEVSQDILVKAKDCVKSQKCLRDPKNTLCKSEYLLDNQVLFVKEKESHSCNKFLPYGLTGVCRCPVRTELYRRYGI